MNFNCLFFVCLFFLWVFVSHMQVCVCVCVVAEDITTPALDLLCGLNFDCIELYEYLYILTKVLGVLVCGFLNGSAGPRL